MATMDVIEIGVNLVWLRGSFNIHGTLTSIEMQEKVLQDTMFFSFFQKQRHFSPQAVSGIAAHP